ncbi:MAG: type II toxin-antitoxin system Phd/YefM family antitoxin [Actinomycetota bacterium]
MAEIGVKELKASASRVIDEVAAGTSYVVTKRGRPAAVLMPVEEAEDLVLANAAEFIRLRRRGREEYRKGRTVPLEELA